MNAISSAPRQVEQESHLIDEKAVALRLLPAPESVRTGNGNGPTNATAGAPFWTWFIENPRRASGA